MGIQGNLGVNADWETYTGSGNTTDWTGWTETRTDGSGTATVEANTTAERFGAACCHLKTTSNDGTASVVTSDYISVTNTLHYVCRFCFYKVSGANSMTVTITQYNSSSVDLTDDITITPTGAAAWDKSHTVIHAAGDGGNDFHASCTKIKVTFSVDTTTADWYVDGFCFAPSEGDKFDAFGTKLFTNGYELAEVRAIGGPDGSTNLIDVTSHDSADQFVEYLAGLRDGGNISISGLFIPSDTNGQMALEADWVAGTSRTFDVILPSAVAEWELTGTCNGFKTDENYNDALAFTANIKLSGKPTLDTADYS